MKLIPQIVAAAEDLTAIRRDIHAHPEIGFQEHRTSALVADLLTRWGIEVTRGIGGTGVVGVLDGSRPGKTIGLRADMDALPMEERTNLPYASKNPGVFHGCGHDGHTATLLGAAQYLAQSRDFAGRAVFIFQPAEEVLGGARAMLADGLFERFPCDELYGLHNSPLLSPGQMVVNAGPSMAGACMFDIHINGKGGHGAHPDKAKDPIVIGAALVSELQSIVSRNMPAVSAAVVSVTRFESGSAYNVIPETAWLAGTTRYFNEADGDKITARMKQICAGLALAHDVEIVADIRKTFSVLENDAQRVADLMEVAREVLGEAASDQGKPSMGSEDMADLLQVVPGAYFKLGISGDVPVHNSAYVFDDAMIPVGATLFARLVETRGAA